MTGGRDTHSAAPLLEMRRVSKAFPGVRALDAVDFELRAGEVHALLGGNGAGKSTLLKVLCGACRPDSGAILLEGRRIQPRSPAEAARLGISTVHQEIALLPDLSVADNLMAGREPTRLGLIDRRECRRRSERALARVGVELDVTAPLGALPVALRQLVAIARALEDDARVLVLDEPTSSLDRRETLRLLELLRRLRATGTGIVFVTHFIEQVFEIADRLTILRNGRLVGRFDAREITRLELVARILGREPDAAFSPAGPPPGRAGGDGPGAPPFLSAAGLGRRAAVDSVDLEIRRGEVLGLAGLLGSGRSETARLLFGLDRADRGELRVGGKRVRSWSPRRAARGGMGFVPEDRREQGIVGELSLRQNLILALQARRGCLRPLRRRRVRELARRFIEALCIDAPDDAGPAETLSGGNQQKVILARWLATEPCCLLLDEPTRGIDVGTKAQVEALVRSLAGRGMAVLFISAEPDEVARVGDRVVVLRERRTVAATCGPVQAAALMATMAGTEAA